MKAITLHQPYASLVALGVKRIETRSWSTSYRGPLAIHASKRTPNQSDLRLWMPLHSAMKRQLPCGKCGHADGWHACLMTHTHCAFCGCDGWTEPTVPLGAVVASCTLVDVVPMTESGHYRPGDEDYMEPHLLLNGLDGKLWLWVGDAHDVEDQRSYGVFSPGRFAWLLTDVRPLTEPIPAKGRQGLWTPDPDLAAALDATAV